MPSSIALILSLFLLADPLPEGKWVPVENPDGLESLQLEINKEGTFVVAFKPKDASAEMTLSGKWKKTGDKKYEMTPDDTNMKPGTAELQDEKTLEVISPEGEKIKFKRQD